MFEFGIKRVVPYIDPEWPPRHFPTKIWFGDGQNLIFWIGADGYWVCEE